MTPQQIEKKFEENEIGAANINGHLVDVIDEVTFIRVVQEMMKQREPEDVKQIWARIINDARWYDGTPQGMDRLINHFMESYYIK